jgi:hypothetical protein
VTSVVTAFFPLDAVLPLGTYSWSPATVAQALRLGVEIPSYRRAAAAFEDLVHLPLSKSRLQQLVKETGPALVRQEAQEAEAMVCVPSQEEVVVWRKGSAPDSEIMNVSSDGVLIHLRQEGWKEVKTVAISAVESVVNPATGAIEVQLTHHSYRAGLWEAATFANHLWVEACQRGLEKAKLVVSVNDGATWIWRLSFCALPAVCKSSTGGMPCNPCGSLPVRPSAWALPKPPRGWTNKSSCWRKATSGRSCTMFVSSTPAVSLCPTLCARRCFTSSTTAGACATANSAKPAGPSVLAPLSLLVKSSSNSA